MRKLLGSLTFLFFAPLLVLLMVIINLMTWSGHWWAQWARSGSASPGSQRC